MAISNQLEKRFLERIKVRQTEYAIASVQKPTDKSEFGYGQASGVFQGLLLAEQLFNEVIGEEENDGA